ncbi:MAG: Gfo/Idh/MocA family protein [Verrucomicrobiales bacterium]
MNDTPKTGTSRREFLKTTGKAAAAVSAVSALAGVSLPHVHAEGSSLVQAALIGCGGRGSGAAMNVLSTKKQGPVKVVAMADVFENKLRNSFEALSRSEYADAVDVPNDRKFIGFDAYKQAMDTLKKGDVAIFATPLAFRWPHFQYAIEKGLHVFMEKPLTADGPSSRKMIELAGKASEKNLKVGVGLMSRHARNMEQLAKRIEDGELGDILMMRGYRMHGPVASFASLPKPPGITDLMYQIQRFHSFIWASGGAFSDYYIHHIDHLCWMKGAWPVRAQALGGRHYKTNPEGIPYVDQNFDNYAVEYTFADGAKLMFNGRCIVGCKPMYTSFVHGTKGMAITSRNGDCGEPSTTYEGQNPIRSKMTWTSQIPEGQYDPYTNEWVDLMDAIRNDKPYNEVKRGVEASVVTSMGRMAAHTGQEITFDQMMNHEHTYAPGVENYTADSEAPVRADANGRYPVPMPGVVNDREYPANLTA